MKKKPATLPRGRARGRPRVACGHIPQLVTPVTSIHRVAVKHEKGWFGIINRFGVKQLGMNTRPAHACKIEMEAVGKRGLEVGRNKLYLWVNGVHFSKSRLPKSIKIVRTRIASLVSC